MTVMNSHRDKFHENTYNEHESGEGNLNEHESGEGNLNEQAE